MQVDFSAYDRLEVHVRGCGEERRHFRKWWWPWRQHEQRVPTHERVLLIARVATEPGLHLKLFRDIPEDDLEALLPETRFKMRLFDHVKIGGAGSTAIAASIMRYVAVFGTQAAGALALPLVILGSLWYAGRTIWGYFSAKDTYRARLMHELFYQVMDSDTGVITRVVDDAEDEEAKETLLLWAAARALGPCALAEAARTVEAHLRAAHGCDVAFDLADARAKCVRLRLLEPSHDGLLRAAPPGVAAVRLAAAQVQAAAAP